MRKTFTLFSIALSAFAFGQSFSLYKTNPSQTAISLTVTNGSSVSETTGANGQTKETFKFVNTSASATTTLGIIRTVIYQNPLLVLNGSTVTPTTYFCFGNTCFPSNTSSVTSADYTILGPAGSTVSPFDNSKDNSQPFITYLDEGSSVGKYFVRYKVYNVADANDTLSFIVKYNEFLSVNEIGSVIESASDVYPNPTSSSASISLILKQESTIKLKVYNSVGALVMSTNDQKYPQGKNKLSVDCSNLNAGIYFVNIDANGTKLTKRLVINK